MRLDGAVSTLSSRRASGARRLRCGILLAGLLALLLGGGQHPPDLGKADYDALHLAMTCASGSRAGLVGGMDDLASPRNFHIAVRTPANYDARLAHPLLVMYAPGGTCALPRRSTMT